MLKTFALRDRDLPLTIYGPPGLRDLVNALGRVFGRLPYRIELVELRAGEALERDEYKLLVFPVSHGVPALGTPSSRTPAPAGSTSRRPTCSAFRAAASVVLSSGASRSPSGWARARARGGPRPAATRSHARVHGRHGTERGRGGHGEGADVLVHEATFGDEERG